jgi:hypothetical protein
MAGEKSVRWFSKIHKHKGKGKAGPRKTAIRESVRRAGSNIKSRDSVKAWLRKREKPPGFFASLFGLGRKKQTRDAEAQDQASE